MEEFEFSIEILDFSPGPHSVLVTVRDMDIRIAADTVSFTTPPRPRVECGVTDNILTCDSSNPIATQLCRFDGGPPIMCMSPFNVLDLGLSLGSHTVDLNVTDVFDRTVPVPVTFSVVSDLMLECSEVEEGISFRGIDCSTTGGIGTVSYSCSFDGSPAEDCESFGVVYVLTMIMITVPHNCI